MPAVLNAANEIAVDGISSMKKLVSTISAFWWNRSFPAIAFGEEPSIDEILTADRWAKEEARKIIKGMKH